MTERELVQVFAVNCKQMRLAIDMSQVELAKAAGTTQDHLSQLEAALVAPRIGILARLAKALQTTPAALLTPGASSPSPRKRRSKATASV